MGLDDGPPCPACGRRTIRSEHLFFEQGAVVLKCPRCRLAAVEGSGEGWVSLGAPGDLAGSAEGMSILRRMAEDVRLGRSLRFDAYLSARGINFRAMNLNERIAVIREFNASESDK